MSDYGGPIFWYICDEETCFFILQNNITESEVSVDPKHHRHFVARRAQVLNDISDEFGGVNISLPKDLTSPIIALKGKLSGLYFEYLHNPNPLNLILTR